MSQRYFLPALFLMVICTFSLSEEIPAEQVALDVSVCNEELSKIRLNVEYLCFLNYVFDSVLSQSEKDTVKVSQKDKEELLLGVLVNLNEQGVVLEKMINRPDSTICTPCFQSAVGNFCKDILILRKSVDQNLISVQNKMAEKPSLFSQSFINYLKKKIQNGSNSGLLPEKITKLRQDVRTAEMLGSTNMHKEALMHILEIIQEVYKLK